MKGQTARTAHLSSAAKVMSSPLGRCLERDICPLVSTRNEQQVLLVVVLAWPWR